MANRELRPRLTRRASGLSLRSQDRSIIADGLASHAWADLYYEALVASWPMFLGALAGLFVAINLLFAALYWVGRDPVANARPGAFADLFFFSVETISTTGYGDMHPQTLYAHSVATVEIFMSLIATAAVTGLIFARFSRPRARLIFARSSVIQRHDGELTLMARVVNARNSFITEATAKMWLLGPSISAEGRRYVGFLPMRLLRSESPALALSWTLFHPIDENSPLRGKTAETAAADEISIVISITGVDETSSQFVHSRHVYAADEMRWGHEYVDMFYRDQEERSHVDVSKVHETKVTAD